MKKIAKKGRPLSADPANIRLHLRITPDQKKKWTKKAEKEGKTLSAWLKDLADKSLLI